MLHDPTTRLRLLPPPAHPPSGAPHALLPLDHRLRPRHLPLHPSLPHHRPLLPPQPPRHLQKPLLLLILILLDRTHPLAHRPLLQRPARVPAQTRPAARPHQRGRVGRHALGGRDGLDRALHAGQRAEVAGGGCLGVGRRGRGDGRRGHGWEVVVLSFSSLFFCF